MKKDGELDVLVKNLIASLSIFNNKHRREILRLCYKEPKTISELKRILNSSDKVTWHNVKQLESWGFVKLTKKKKEKSHPVFVKSIVEPEDILSAFEIFFNDLKKKILKEDKKRH